MSLLDFRFRRTTAQQDSAKAKPVAPPSFRDLFEKGENLIRRYGCGEEGRELLRQSLSAAEQASDATTADLRVILAALATSHFYDKNYQEAEAIYRRILSLLDPATPTPEDSADLSLSVEPKRRTFIVSRIAWCVQHTSGSVAAIPYFEKVLLEYKRTNSYGDLNALGRALLYAYTERETPENGDAMIDEMVGLFDAAEEYLAKPFLQMAANWYRDRDQPAKALPLYTRYLAFAKDQRGYHDPEWVACNISCLLCSLRTGGVYACGIGLTEWSKWADECAEQHRNRPRGGCSSN